MLCKNGKGLHEIDFTPYKIVDNSVFVLRPGQVHRLEMKVGCTGYLVEFNNEFYHPTGKSTVQRLRKASNKNYCLADSSRFNKLQAILTSIHREYTDREEGFGDVIKANLDIFFIELVRQSPDPKGHATGYNPYTQERFEEFLALLDKHIATQKQVSQYSALMNLSLLPTK